VLARYRPFDPEQTAELLRSRLKGKALAGVLEDDIRQGAVTELRGWVIPQTLAELCALAAKVG
jgi:hypothetical protein